MRVKWLSDLPGDSTPVSDRASANPGRVPNLSPQVPQSPQAASGVRSEQSTGNSTVMLGLLYDLTIPPLRKYPINRRMYIYHHGSLIKIAPN